MSLFQRMHRIEASLSFQEGRTEPPSCDLALAWCLEHKAVLRKIGSTLEGELRLQEYIELVRPGTCEGRRKAVQYARKYFLGKLGIVQSSDTNHGYDPLYKRAMGLLAVPESSGLYADLYHTQRWHALKEAFRRTAFQVYNMAPIPLLHIALSAGLSSLKALSCASSTATQDDTAGHESHGPYSHDMLPLSDSKRNCPTCQTNNLGVLAAKVPRNRQEHSTLLCRVTGKVMDDKNPAMCLPNGMIYSQEVRVIISHQAMTWLASQSRDHSITCPRTGETYAPSDCRKLFIS